MKMNRTTLLLIGVLVALIVLVLATPQRDATPPVASQSPAASPANGLPAAATPQAQPQSATPPQFRSVDRVPDAGQAPGMAPSAPAAQQPASTASPFGSMPTGSGVPAEGDELPRGAAQPADPSPGTDVSTMPATEGSPVPTTTPGSAQ